MKTLFIQLIFSLLLFSNVLNAQYQYNDFEINYDLDIQIDSLSADTLWQIGVPQKEELNQVISPPNVLITDTIQSYPNNTNASFTVELDEGTVDFFPYIQIEWYQSTDFENKADGGIIEASYDQGQTWSNVFDDPNYRPDIVGSYQIDTLHNGQIGITGASDLAWMAVCWGSYTGTPPENVTTVQIRFTFTSDDNDTQQEGWLIDNMSAFTGVIGSTNSPSSFPSFVIMPNPATDEISLNLDRMIYPEAHVQIFNSVGQLVYTNPSFSTRSSNTISVSDLLPGVYYVLAKSGDAYMKQKFIKAE